MKIKWEIWWYLQFHTCEYGGIFVKYLRTENEKGIQWSRINPDDNSWLELSDDDACWMEVEYADLKSKRLRKNPW